MNDQMRKLIGIAGVLTALVCLGMGCGKEDLSALQTNGESFSDSLSIKAGQTAVAENGDKLTFIKVLDDSRCPATAICIWQGFVSAELLAETAAGKQTFTLTTNPDVENGETAVIMGYEVSLVNVLPYPGTSVEEPKPEDFWIELVVKKAGE